LQLADRPRLQQRQISWAKNEELKQELEAVRASVERPGGEDDPRRHGLLKARENLLWIGPVSETPACAWHIFPVFFLIAK
jgi:hypothetical protein